MNFPEGGTTSALRCIHQHPLSGYTCSFLPFALVWR
jgi:hypothetical protein